MTLRRLCLNGLCLLMQYSIQRPESLLCHICIHVLLSFVVRTTHVGVLWLKLTWSFKRGHHFNGFCLPTWYCNVALPSCRVILWHKQPLQLKSPRHLYLKTSHGTNDILYVVMSWHKVVSAWYDVSQVRINVFKQCAFAWLCSLRTHKLTQNVGNLNQQTYMCIFLVVKGHMYS